MIFEAIRTESTMLRAGASRRRPEDFEYLELRAAGHFCGRIVVYHVAHCWRHRFWHRDGRRFGARERPAVPAGHASTFYRDGLPGNQPGFGGHGEHVRVRAQITCRGARTVRFSRRSHAIDATPARRRDGLVDVRTGSTSWTKSPAPCPRPTQRHPSRAARATTRPSILRVFALRTCTLGMKDGIVYCGVWI